MQDLDVLYDTLPVGEPPLAQRAQWLVKVSAVDQDILKK